MSPSCPACGSNRLRMISEPRPEYVERCRFCGSAFFHFGSRAAVSHREQYNVDEQYQGYLDALNTPALVKRHLETLARLRELCSGERPSVFDIGAGAGGFLVAARESGFEVAGNEISPPAIGAAKRQGIDLTFGDDLHAIAADAKYDAVTMWCILAHVDDPSALMHGIQDLLRPGGVLFFHTPRRCLVDGVALSLQRLTGGRYRKMFDRRINGIHRRQYSKKGLESFLRREGFEPILVEPVIAYGLRIEAYLTRIGIPRTISRPLGRILEKCGEVGLLPRNTLNVYARPSSMPRSLI